ncbi:hypothetical protein DAEQUDRAFT_328815 [Daedalea quercina L-15889]|uniref:Uncharacterized protein n=1 Tax=Daedalea quercina L-15889 TaxID=1314783 RepID=A0A165PQ83_9APHY|nr:hypothetical protein DAEQUDRAFT_328815 [Daedalea quercina L-15889]
MNAVPFCICAHDRACMQRGHLGPADGGWISCLLCVALVGARTLYTHWDYSRRMSVTSACICILYVLYSTFHFNDCSGVSRSRRCRVRTTLPDLSLISVRRSTRTAMWRRHADIERQDYQIGQSRHQSSIRLRVARDCPLFALSKQRTNSAAENLCPCGRLCADWRRTLEGAGTSQAPLSSLAVQVGIHFRKLSEQDTLDPSLL